MYFDFYPCNLFFFLNCNQVAKPCTLISKVVTRKLCWVTFTFIWINVNHDYKTMHFAPHIDLCDSATHSEDFYWYSFSHPKLFVLQLLTIPVLKQSLDHLLYIRFGSTEWASYASARCECQVNSKLI